MSEQFDSIRRTRRLFILCLVVIVLVFAGYCAWAFVTVDARLQETTQLEQEYAILMDQAKETQEPDDTSSDVTTSEVPDDSSEVQERTSNVISAAFKAGTKIATCQNDYTSLQLAAKGGRSDEDRLNEISGDISELFDEDSRVWRVPWFVAEGCAWEFTTTYAIHEEQFPVLWVCRNENDALMACAVGVYDVEVGVFTDVDVQVTQAGQRVLRENDSDEDGPAVSQNPLDQDLDEDLWNQISDPIDVAPSISPSPSPSTEPNDDWAVGLTPEEKRRFEEYAASIGKDPSEIHQGPDTDTLMDLDERYGTGELPKPSVTPAPSRTGGAVNG